MDLGLKGLRAVVTGGSRGIGRRCADLFAQERAHVGIRARNAGEVAKTVVLAPQLIRLNCVSPCNASFDGGMWRRTENTNAKLFADALALNPTRRMAKPEEVARDIVFLASPASCFTTRTNPVMDGAPSRGVQF